MKTYIVYTEEGCVDCNALKTTLTEQGIKYVNRDINKECSECGINLWRNRFEKNDLVAEHSLPGYVPILTITENNETKILASGMKYEERGKVIIFENTEQVIKNL